MKNKTNIYCLLVGFTVLLSSINDVYSQLNQIVLSHSDSGQKTYVANQKIQFLPGYSFTASSVNRMIAYIDAGVVTPPFYSDLYTASSFENHQLNVSNSVGSIAGSPNVGGTGAFTYSIPIQIPLGTNGMIPQIGIGYNSQSGNGLLGMGWNLQGLSVIYRATKDLYSDSEVKDVQFDNKDVFSLDGSKLIGLSGTYGTNGAVYGTESEDFSRIYSHGTQGTGPAWFEVKTKDGIIIEYGKTADARLTHGNTVLFWMISRIKDANGNYVEYEYEGEHDELRVKEIRYTGNTITGVIPYNTIRFFYKERADPFDYYVNFKKVENNSILDHIVVLADGQQFKKYEFKYGCKLYSFLNEVIEYGSGSERFNSTIFKYATENEGEIQLPNNEVLAATADNNIFYLTGDFNADGRTDIVKVTAGTLPGGIVGSDRIIMSNQMNYQILTNSSENEINFQQIGTASITSSSTLVMGYGGSYSQYGSLGSGMNLFDFNGDGKTDIFYYELNYNSTYGYSISNVRFHKAKVDQNGVGFDLVYGSINSLFTERYIHNVNQFSFIGDFNGDGISDVLYVTRGQFGGYRAGILKGSTADFYLGFGNTNQRILDFNDAEFLATADRVDVIDFDGDGKSELMIVKEGVTKIYSFDKKQLQSPNITVDTYPRLVYQAGFPTKWHDFELGDFNGDGRTDILTRSSDGNKFIVHYSRTDNWFEPKEYTFKNAAYNANKDKWIIADLNGDGKTDILHFDNQNLLDANLMASRTLVTAYYSNGSSFDYSSKLFTHHTQPAPSFDFIELTSQRALVGNFMNKSYSLLIVPEQVNFYHTGLQTYMPFTRYKQLDLKINPHLNVLTHIKDGFNNELSIEYGNIDNSSIGEYALTGPHPANSPHYPVRNFNYPLKVVKKIITSTPIGTTTAQEFSFWGGKYHLRGKRFLGFSKVEQKDNLTGITSSSEYGFNSDNYQQYLKKTKAFFTQDEQLISEVEYESDFTTLANNRYLYFVSEEETTDHIHGRTISKSYDYDNATGNLNTSTTDNNGVETTVATYSYGAFGSTLNIPNKVTQSTVTITRNGEAAFSAASHFNYDIETGNATEAIQNYGTSESITKALEYDQYGNVTKETISASGITPRIKENVYDNKGKHLTKQINELGQESSVEYHPVLGKPIKTKDIHGLITQITYDEFGRERTTTNPMGNTLTKSYDWVNTSPQSTSGNPLQADDVMWKMVTSGSGMPQQATYMNKYGMKRMSTVQGMNNDIITITAYNERGQVFTETAPFFDGASEVLINEYTYDNFNRLTKTENQAGETTVAYQSAGGVLKTTITQPDGVIKAKEEDASGKLTKATDEGGVLTYSYFSHGGVKDVKLDGVTVTTSEYDHLGRQTKLIDANAGETAYKYNTLGELITQTNANNKITQMTYDVVGRLNQRTMPDRVLDMEYHIQGNGLNQIKKITYTDGVEEFVYDQLQRPLEMKRIIDGQEFIFKYTYDQFGNVQKMEYPSGYFVNNTYDNKGYLIKVTDPENTVLWKADEQDATGKITKFTKGDEIQTEIKYNNLNILEEIKAGGIEHLVYKIDKENGNLLERKDLIKGLVETFQYDNAERLTKMSCSPLSNPMLTFNDIETEYADNGNISFKTDIGNYAYHPEKINAVTGVENPNEVISFNAQQITYNAFAKTKTITEGNQRMYFTYGSDDERVMTKLVELDGTNETTLLKKYFFGLYEKEVEGSVTRHINYVSAGDGITAIVVEENTERNTYYTYKDHLGSIVAITDEEGELFFEQNFDAWGRYRNTDDWSYSTINEAPTWLRGYTGHEYLTQFDLVNMNGRMYDPAIGRMLRPDNFVQQPTNSQSYNRYSYVFNNPLKYTDPSGELGIFSSFSANIVFQWVSGFFSTGGGFKARIAAGDERVRNGYKLIGGLFQYDKSYSGKGDFWRDTKQILSRFTWEAPQTAGGFLYNNLLNLFGGVDEVDYYYGATMVTNNNTDVSVALGSYITLGGQDPETKLGIGVGSYTTMHEYGHYLQSQEYGVLYLFKVGLQSSLGNAHWTEKDANYRVAVYFNKIDKTFNWNEKYDGAFSIYSNFTTEGIENNKPKKAKWWEYLIHFMAPGGAFYSSSFAP